MKINLMIPGLVLFSMFFVFNACSQDKPVESSAYNLVLKGLLDHSVKEMNVAEADIGRFKLLDARERPEFEVSHIEGAVWVGYDDFDIARVDSIPKTDSILVYCSVGYRSEKVADKLEEAGFENVWNLYGGIFEWKNQDGQVVDEDGEATERVHAFDKTWGRWLRKGEKVYDK